MNALRKADEFKVEFFKHPRRALILTTVVHESRAVNAHLSNDEFIIGSHDVIYTVGTFSDPSGDWLVVHAICQAGNVDAAVTASKAYRDFGAFDVQMFVGVAGSLKEDLPIGSVVVGNYVYNAHSAKTDDGGSYSRPHSHTAAPELLQAANILIVNETWVGMIRPPKPGQLPAVQDYPCDYPPTAQIKAIASGEEVVAGGKTPLYHSIRRHLSDAAAIEMEGWGAMSAAHSERTSAIVVRGISDMCAGKEHVSDTRCQPVASAHAAAFAFSILSMRSRAMPSPPTTEELQPLVVVDSIYISEPRSEFVLNLRGTLDEWPQEKIDAIVRSLQDATGDKKLTLIRIEKGSVRLVFEVRDKDLPELDIEKMKIALSDFQHDLLGALTADELRLAQEAKSALGKASVNLLGWERTLPDGGWLDRPELFAIETRFEATTSSTVLLGDPGSGKSALLATVALTLLDLGVPVLAIKADFLSPSLRTEEDLQADLGLPDLPTVLLEHLARYQPVFLIIDQLDALASQVDLLSDRLNVMLNLVRRVGGLPNVHVLLSARTFEFNHDVRLRSVNAEALTLSLPAWHVVKEKLAEAGVNTERWPANAREVIRSPQALKTYLSLDKKNDDAPFSKYQSMLESLWLQSIADSPNAEALAQLASDLSGTMADEEALWLASARFDTQLISLNRLEAVGLIVRSDDKKSIAFSHQTVFEYVLARSFVKNAGRLSTYVLERQDSLFVRPKLWSALRYLRDVEAISYEREFLQLWVHRDLRRHLRLLLIEFLGEQHDPTAAEKRCLDETIASVDLRLATLKSIAGSRGWFEHFAFSDISSAMKGNDVERGLSLRILQQAWSFEPGKVARLLRENWLNQPSHDEYTWLAITTLERWPEDVQGIASTVLERTPIGNWSVDHTASVLAVHQPDKAFQLIRKKLDYSLEQARAVPAGRPYPEDGTLQEKMSWHISDSPKKPIVDLLEAIDWPTLPAMAKEQPKMFLMALWPWFRSTFIELLQRERPVSWDYRFPGVYALDLRLPGEKTERFAEHRTLLLSLRNVIEALAIHDQDYFVEWVSANQSIEFAPVQSLIAYGFMCAPQHYAERILSWLCEDTRRFQLGSSGDAERTTIELVRATSPFWTNEQVKQLETQVVNYKVDVPKELVDPKQRRRFNQYVNDLRTRILASIPLQKLSAAGQIAVDVKKMDRAAIQGQQISTISGFIGSPMSSLEMQKAKDRDIIKIFREVPDSTNWDHPSALMRGGNVQLSRAFAEFAKQDPARALRIIEQFEPSAQERAAAYALETLADSGEHDSAIQDSVRDLCLRGFGSQEFTTSTAHAIEKIAERHVFVEPVIVDIMTGWLQKSHGDPTEESSVASVDANEEGDNEFKGSALWGLGGISILPGGNFPILSALASILLNDGAKGRDRFIGILNEHLTWERNVKVWQALLIRLSNAGGSTPEIVSNFVKSLFSRYPFLLETHESIRFLAYAQRWDDMLVYELIAPWFQSKKSMIRQAYGELVGLISIVRDSIVWREARELILKEGTAESKVGLAYAGVNLWNEESLHRQACDLLTVLVADADATRMSAILDVFRICDELVPVPATLKFLQTLAGNEADLSNASSSFIVERLQSLLPHAADLVSTIAMKLVESWRHDLTNISSATSLAAPQLTDLSITLHRLGGSSRSAGVRIFEALLDIDAYGTRDILAEVDGRIGSQSMIVQRINRRTAKRIHPHAN